MALNLDLLNKRKEELESQGTSYEFWNPKDGRNKIRVLPPKGDAEIFWSECKLHYNVGPEKKAVTCLGTKNKKCPVCEKVKALKKTGNKEDAKYADKMRATSRVYFNILDRTDKEKADEPQIYGCGTSVLKELLAMICDPDIGDITDYSEGFDVILNKSGKGMNTNYTVTLSPKSCVASKLSEEELQAALIDPESLIVVKEASEIEAILSGEDAEDEDEEEDIDDSEDVEDIDEDDSEDVEDESEDTDEDDTAEEEDEKPAKSKAKAGNKKMSLQDKIKANLKK